SATRDRAPAHVRLPFRAIARRALRTSTRRSARGTAGGVRPGGWTVELALERRTVELARNVGGNATRGAPLHELPLDGVERRELRMPHRECLQRFRNAEELAEKALEVRRER